jgi:hypothetical protein
MKYVVWGLVFALIVLHQDNWLWEDGTLVFGFLPIALLYHAGISLAAALTWLLATKYAWPEGLEAAVVDSQSEPSSASGDSAIGSQEGAGA